MSRSRPDQDPRREDTASYKYLEVDLSQPADWTDAERSFRSELSTGLYSRAVLIHCAATVGPLGFAGEVDEHEYRRSVVLNAVAPQVLGRSFIEAVRNAPVKVRATLVLMSTGTTSGVYEGWSSYKPGKAAVDEWVRITAVEESARGDAVRVLAIAPGVVATGMQSYIRGLDEADFPRAGKFHDLYETGRLRDPAAAARGIWALLDEQVDNGAVIDLRASG
jgi:benzil reductase ((S)-benzoin forming)